MRLTSQPLQISRKEGNFIGFLRFFSTGMENVIKAKVVLLVWWIVPINHDFYLSYPNEYWRFKQLYKRYGNCL
jgi:hypothetical protein